MPQTSAVKFGELPPAGRESQIQHVREAVAELKARPGEWAIVARKPKQTSANSFARKVRDGIGSWRPAGAFEAAVRGTDVWARYVGGEK